VAATPAAPLYNMAILPGRQNPPADEADEGEESSGFANLSGVLMIAPQEEAAVAESQADGIQQIPGGSIWARPFF